MSFGKNLLINWIEGLEKRDDGQPLGLMFINWVNRDTMLKEMGVGNMSLYFGHIFPL